MRLYLASGSPRRREILTELGYEFEKWTADFDESTVALDEPADAVQTLALGKATAAANAFREERSNDVAAAAVGGSAGEYAIFLGSDTVVALDNAVMGKPADAVGAKQMLRALSGKTHVVFTGVALVEVDERGSVVSAETFVEATEVTFFELSDEEIDWYVGTGEPMDKAGAYGIQGLGRVLVRGICGDYETVVGLPAARVYRALREHGIVPV